MTPLREPSLALALLPSKLDLSIPAPEGTIRFTTTFVCFHSYPMEMGTRTHRNRTVLKAWLFHTRLMKILRTVCIIARTIDYCHLHKAGCVQSVFRWWPCIGTECYVH